MLITIKSPSHPQLVPWDIYSRQLTENTIECSTAPANSAHWELNSPCHPSSSVYSLIVLCSLDQWMAHPLLQTFKSENCGIILSFKSFKWRPILYRMILNSLVSQSFPESSSTHCYTFDSCPYTLNLNMHTLLNYVMPTIFTILIHTRFILPLCKRFPLSLPLTLISSVSFPLSCNLDMAESSFGVTKIRYAYILSHRFTYLNGCLHLLDYQYFKGKDFIFVPSAMRCACHSTGLNCC